MTLDRHRFGPNEEGGWLIGYGELGFESKGKAERLFKDAENLRNRLAHFQDLVLGT